MKKEDYFDDEFSKTVIQDAGMSLNGFFLKNSEKRGDREDARGERMVHLLNENTKVKGGNSVTGMPKEEGVRHSSACRNIQVFKGQGSFLQAHDSGKRGTGSSGSRRYRIALVQGDEQHDIEGIREVAT